MEEIVSLIIPFIALAIISVMIDKLTLFLEGVMHKVPNFPDHLEWYVAYAFVLITSTIVCWQGDFRFFDYLNLYFPTYLDYLMTGLVISGGSAFVRTQFSMIESIPMAITGVTSTFTRFVSRKPNNSNIKSNESTQNEQHTNYVQSNNEFPPADDEYPPAEEIIENNKDNRYSDDI